MTLISNDLITGSFVVVSVTVTVIGNVPVAVGVPENTMPPAVIAEVAPVGKPPVKLYDKLLP